MRTLHASTTRGANLAAVALLSGVALALAGCGGAKQATTTSTLQLPGNVPLPPRNPITPMTYTAQLSGIVGTAGLYPAPPGAPNASGLAVISVHPPHELCWAFSQLKNVVAPTRVNFYRRTAGPYSWSLGFPLGHRYRPSGCVPVPKRLALLRALEEHTTEWYVSIHTKRFPEGAVRGLM